MGTSGRTGWAHFGHGTGATNQRTSIRRTAGSVGGTSGWLRLRVFCAKPQVLKECESNHAEHGVVMEAVP